MPRLTRSLAAWNTPAFDTVLKEEIAQLDVDSLPLQQGLSSGSTSLDSSLGVMILRVHEAAHAIQVRAGIFYSSVLSGCSCADDPSPIEENTEYCEVELDIDRETGETRISLARDC
jgi:hypothetical protein